MSGKVLFACSKCFARHPFEDLSKNLQLCKNCRGNSSSKCTYCRSEFQPNSAGKTTNACKKCEYSLNKFGKPSACECCNIVAAFGGNSKCLRCSSYESKYGPPVTCDECKQRSAFDKRDENKKVNGKLLCWLCTCAYKRVLIKAHQDGRISKKRPHEKSHRDHSGANSSSAKRSSQQRSAELSTKTTTSSSSGLELPEKISRQSATGPSGIASAGGSGGGIVGVISSTNGSIPTPIDNTSSDHVVAMTQLKERIAGLERRLTQKDRELFEKDKQLTELKGKNFEKEIEMRNKLKESDRLNELKIDNLNKKVSSLMKEVATLKKTNKKNGTNNRGGGGSSGGASTAAKDKEDKESVSTKDSGGSGTDSPSTN